MRGEWCVYTTFYPAALGFAPDFFRCLRAQEDQDFSLCVGLDGLTPGALARAAGREVAARFVEARPGESPAALRSRALSGILPRCAGVVLMDGDDLAYPDRIGAAKAALAEADVTACAMDLVDAQGRPLGGVFPPAGDSPDPLRANVYGFSNTAYRAEALARCLPVPDDCVLMDWFVSSLARRNGGVLGFDHAPRLAYRQYGANLAQVLPPFDREQLARAARLVLGHYDLLERAGIVAGLDEARQRVRGFLGMLGEDGAGTGRYLQALNALPGPHRWWEFVAHPALEELWKN